MRLFSLILITCLALQFWLPWWTIMVVPLTVCVWKADPPGRSFFISFLAVFVLWLSASILIHFRSGGLLSERVSQLLQIGSPVLLIFATALIGGLAAGAAGLAGAMIRKIT